MTDGYKQSEMMTHKEEKPSCIHSDSQERQNIQDKLKTCIDPLDPADHPNGLVNIVTGRVVPDIVNAGKSDEIGRAQMNAYQQSWPSGFNDTLSKKVVTMYVCDTKGTESWNNSCDRYKYHLLSSSYTSAVKRYRSEPGSSV